MYDFLWHYLQFQDPRIHKTQNLSVCQFHDRTLVFVVKLDWKLENVDEYLKLTTGPTSLKISTICSSVISKGIFPTKTTLDIFEAAPGSNFLSKEMSQRLFLEYFESLTPEQLSGIYQHSPLNTKFIFRLLPSIAQYIVQRLLLIEDGVPFSEIKSWHPASEKRYARASRSLT